MPVVSFRQTIASIFYKRVGKADFLALQCHVREMPERVWVGIRAMLAEVLYKICALFIILSAGSTVVTGIQAAFLIELDIKSVSSTFSENFKNFCLGMIAPDGL